MTGNASVGEKSVLSKELRLSNGVTLSNRIAQSAMTEHLATGDGAPSRQLIEAYKRFAVSGAALIISGNVMVNGWSLEAPRNVVIEDDRHLPQLRQWAATTAGTDARLILQLSLAGRQSQRGLALAGRRQDVATASAVPMSIGGPLFKPPRALSDLEIRQIIGQFATAARIAAEAGFAGVQVHAAHGYSLSQFLSPLVNQRTDNWGGSAEKRMRMLIEIVRAVGSVTPQSFLLTVKMNVSDFQPGGFDAAEALAVAKALENEGVHLIEFSGGTYESSAMIDGGVARDPSGARKAYFLSYAKEFARELSVPMMLSGGFRSRTGHDRCDREWCGGCHRAGPTDRGRARLSPPHPRRQHRGQPRQAAESRQQEHRRPAQWRLVSGTNRPPRARQAHPAEPDTHCGAGDHAGDDVARSADREDPRPGGPPVMRARTGAVSR